MNRSALHEQATAILQGVLCSAVFVVLLQLWLLNATLNAWLGGDDAILWPAAVVSIAYCLVNACLLRYLNRLDQP
jgi:hypothetical protein